MSTLSFQPEYLDALLLCDKQQTTRPLTDRFHVGDIGQIYIQQRRRITEKPLRRMTRRGSAFVHSKIVAGKYPEIDGHLRFGLSLYHAHFIGTVQITEVIDIRPCMMPSDCLELWAVDDGFADFSDANGWFSGRYGKDWGEHWWTVDIWDGWLERYFEPGEVNAV